MIAGEEKGQEEEEATIPVKGPLGREGGSTLRQTLNKIQVR